MDTDPYSYNLPSLYQNVLVEAGGKVFVPAIDHVRQEGERSFPAELHGRPFDDVLTNVRNAARTAARDEGSVVASMLFAC
jgi:hypothetical protein